MLIKALFLPWCKHHLRQKRNGVEKYASSLARKNKTRVEIFATVKRASLFPPSENYAAKSVLPFCPPSSYFMQIDGKIK
jgi:hypothetical protein